MFWTKDADQHLNVKKIFISSSRSTFCQFLFRYSWYIKDYKEGGWFWTKQKLHVLIYPWNIETQECSKVEILKIPFTYLSVHQFRTLINRPLAVAPPQPLRIVCIYPLILCKLWTCVVDMMLVSHSDPLCRCHNCFAKATKFPTLSIMNS